MFETVSKVAIHQQQFKLLLKRRAKLVKQPIFDAKLQHKIEHKLLVHAYTIAFSDEASQLANVASQGSELGIFVHFYKLLSAEKTSGTDNELTFVNELIALYESDPEQFEVMVLLFGLLISHFTNAKGHAAQSNNVCDQPSNIKQWGIDTAEQLKAIQYSQSERYNLLQQISLKWDESALKGYRQKLLNQPVKVALPLAGLLTSQQQIPPTELIKHYEHVSHEIALAGFILGFQRKDKTAPMALFNRFSNTEDPHQKAQLLSLAGLTHDPKWVEPCLLFCQAHPEFTLDVLISFHAKVFLPLIIQLMQIPNTAQASYQAWLYITDRPLTMEAAIRIAGEKTNTLRMPQEQQDNMPLLPNKHQAELYRQQFMEQQGELLIKGHSLGYHSIQDELKSFRGIAIQRALLLNHEGLAGLAKTHFSNTVVFSQVLTANQYTHVFHDTTINGVGNAS
ncbi:hypothetical protein [Flocculibacter collagenilyticus]|uniref:hypothetical protein n=1 Tax=Flocculibacter collagenilyticus TaxID=2744479 RepID=UPI0018F33394|nr:hypothetical protein [Flocculibacter collagenilyticus]